MAEKLAQLGVAVERSVELVDFLDLSDRVELTLKHSDGTEERSSTPFLLGCDGAHSLVRRHLRLPFEGKTFPGSYLLADVHIDWDMPDENEFYVFASDEGLLPIFNLGGGISRLVADLDPAPPADTSPNGKAAAIISSALPQPLNVWHVMNTNAPALAEQYGKERPSFHLIRPGGYVMLRGTPADADKAADFCRRLFYRTSV